jgi:hypothetical protein
MLTKQIQLFLSAQRDFLTTLRSSAFLAANAAVTTVAVWFIGRFYRNRTTCGIMIAKSIFMT